MPDDLAAELDRLDKAATPGPWDIRLNGPEDETQWCDLTHLDARWPHLPQVHGCDLSIEDAELIVFLRNHTDEIKAALVERLPDPKGGCACHHHFQDAGGGYTEHIVEYEGACPVHSEHVYDPREGAWIFREPHQDRDWWREHAKALEAERDRHRDRADGLAEDRAQLRATVERVKEMKSRYVDMSCEARSDKPSYRSVAKDLIEVLNGGE